MAVLTNGYTIQMHTVESGTSINLYPYTRAKNVFMTDGSDLQTKVADILGRNFVPELATGASINSLTFLRNDGTFVAIQDATAPVYDVDTGDLVTAAQKGVVALTSDANGVSESLALTQKGAKTLKDAIDALSTGSANAYVAKTQLGVATVTDNTDPQNPVTTVGVATLDTSGKVPSSQLPSFVDEIVDVTITWNGGAVDTVTYAHASDDGQHAAGDAVTLATGKIYVDAATNKTYRYSGSTLVEISESLALGETDSTAYRGDRGKIAYDHSQTAHARNDAVLVTDSTTNGCIEVYGTTAGVADSTATTITVYEHPIANGFDSTNPHGITKTTIGLGNVENKSSETIRSELTSANVTTALGYTPATQDVATDSTSGLMTAAMVKKLDKTKEIYVSSTQPTPTANTEDYLWYEIVADETA